MFRIDLRIALETFVAMGDGWMGRVDGERQPSP